MSYSLTCNIPEEGTVHSPVLAPLSVTQRRERVPSLPALRDRERRARTGLGLRPAYF